MCDLDLQLMNVFHKERIQILKKSDFFFWWLGGGGCIHGEGGTWGR